jgi:uncharacterized protein YciI
LYKQYEQLKVVIKRLNLPAEMKQYLITGYDHTDPEALERRMSVREQHLENVRNLKKSGSHILGGAILNEQGMMIGSSMVLQFETDEAFNNWLENEIYITAKVWDKVDIRPFRVAEV